MAEVTNEVAREPYEAPAIEDIPLRPDEQVLKGCKQPSGSGQGVGRPTGCTVAAGCVTIGNS